MKKYSASGGIIGAILLFFGALNFLVAAEWDMLTTVLITLGAVFSLQYAVFNFQAVKSVFSKRSTQHLGNAVIASLMVLGILVILNFIFMKRNARYDLTEIKQFTLSELTINVLENLKEDVRITAFERAPNRLIFDSIFKEFQHYSDRIDYEFIDPDQQPAVAKNYGVQAYGAVVFECGDRTEKVNGNKEQTLTNALIKVTREESKTVYFMTGHGERGIEDFGRTGYSNIKDQIINQNYVVKTLDLAREKSIPEDCSVLILNGPESEPFSTELDTIDAYINRGGKVMFLLEPDPAARLTDFMDKWGLRVGNDMIIDNSGVGRLFGMGPEVPLVSQYGKHMIVQDFGQQNTFFPTARSVTPKKSVSVELAEVEPLAVTSRNSWGEVDFPKADQRLSGEKGSVQYDEGSDLRGPVCVAALVTKRLQEGAPEDIADFKRGAMAVFGDADFASNVFSAHNPNVALFLNAVNFLAQEEDLVSIPPKDPQDRRIAMTVYAGRVCNVFFN